MGIPHPGMTLEDGSVIARVAYQEEHYASAAKCVEGIRRFLLLGWQLVELRGAVDGPFLALWRKEDQA